MRCLYCEDMQQERVEELIDNAVAYGCSTESILCAVITGLVSHAYDAEGKQAPHIVRLPRAPPGARSTRCSAWPSTGREHQDGRAVRY
jgi:hypothetical protein